MPAEGGTPTPGNVVAEEQLRQLEADTARLETIGQELAGKPGWKGAMKFAKPEERLEKIKAFIDSGDRQALMNVMETKGISKQLDEIDQLKGRTKAASAPEAAPVAPPAAEKKASTTAKTPEKKDRSAELQELNKLDREFRAAIEKYAKEKDPQLDKAFHRGSVVELWLRAKRSGLNPVYHPFFARRTADLPAFGAFADSLNEKDEARYDQAVKAGVTRVKFYSKGSKKGTPAERFSNDISEDLQSQIVNRLEIFADKVDPDFASVPKEERLAQVSTLLARVSSGETISEEELKAITPKTKRFTEMLDAIMETSQEISHLPDDLKEAKRAQEEVLDAPRKAAEEAARVAAEAAAATTAAEEAAKQAESARVAAEQKAEADRLAAEKAQADKDYQDFVGNIAAATSKSDLDRMKTDYSAFAVRERTHITADQDADFESALGAKKMALARETAKELKSQLAMAGSAEDVDTTAAMFNTLVLDGTLSQKSFDKAVADAKAKFPAAAEAAPSKTRSYKTMKLGRKAEAAPLTADEFEKQMMEGIAEATTPEQFKVLFNKLYSDVGQGHAKKGDLESEAVAKWKEEFNRAAKKEFWDPLDAAVKAEEARALSPKVEEFIERWGADLMAKDKFFAEVERVASSLEAAPAAAPKEDEFFRILPPKQEVPPLPFKTLDQRLRERRDELLDQIHNETIAFTAWDAKFAALDDDFERTRVVNRWLDAQHGKGKMDDAELANYFDDPEAFKIWAKGLEAIDQEIEDIDSGKKFRELSGMPERTTLTASATEADVRKREEEEREIAEGGPGFWATLKGFFKRKPKPVPMAGSKPMVRINLADREPKVKGPAAVGGPSFWQDIDKRFSAYVRGELTESEQKGLEQDKRWIAARMGLEVAGAVFGPKVVTDTSRLHFTNKEFSRLQEAIKAAGTVEISPTLTVETTPEDQAEDIANAIRESKFLTDEKKEELIARINKIMEDHSVNVESVRKERDALIATNLDEALQLTSRKLTAGTSAVNTLMLASGVGMLGLGGQLARPLFNSAASQMERYQRIQDERVRKGEETPDGAMRVIRDMGTAAGRGFAETALQLMGQRGKLGFAIGGLTLLKYYGLSEVTGEEAHKLAERLLGSAETEAGVVHATAVAPGLEAAGAREAIVTPREGTTVPVTEAPAEAPTAEEAENYVAPEEAANYAQEPQLTLEGEARPAIESVEKLKELATVKEGDGIIKVVSRQIEAADQATLEKMGFKGDFDNEQAKHLFAMKEANQIVSKDGLMHSWLSKDSIGKAVVLTEKGGDYHVAFADLDKATEVSPEAEHLTMAPIEPKAPEVPTEELGMPTGGSVVVESELAPWWRTAPEEVTPATPEAIAAAEESPWGVVEPVDAPSPAWGPGDDTPEAIWGEPPAPVAPLEHVPAVMGEMARIAPPVPEVTPEETATVEFGPPIKVGDQVIEFPPGKYTPEQMDKLLIQAQAADKHINALKIIEHRFEAMAIEDMNGITPAESRFNKFLHQLEEHRTRELATQLNRMENPLASVRVIDVARPLTSKETFDLAFADIEQRAADRGVAIPMSKEEWDGLKDKLIR